MATRIQLKTVQFSTRRISKAIQTGIRRELRKALKEFLYEVIANVPVDTGMARGALKPLGRFLRTAIPISPKRFDPYKNARVGEAFSSIDTSGFEAPNYKIELDIGVWHYLLNEYFPLRSNRGVPWKSLEKGKEAYIKYLKANLKKNVSQVVSYRSNVQVDI